MGGCFSYPLQENFVVDTVGIAAIPFKYAYEVGETTGQYITGQKTDPDFDPVLAYEAVGTQVKIPARLNSAPVKYSWWNVKQNLNTRVELHGMSSVLESIRHVKRTNPNIIGAPGNRP